MTTSRLSRKGVFLAVLLLSACTKTVFITPELPLPPVPVVPTVFATEMECLTPESYEAILLRETRLMNYIHTLRDIITTHNDSAAKTR